MSRSKILRRKRVDISDLQRYVAITMGFLLVVFIIAQFVVLDLAGIHGPEITQLRNDQEDMKLEIELKRSQINDMTKSAKIKSYATDNLGFEAALVNSIQVEEADSVATLSP